MHFKLPKPLLGWREFAGEVGVIVLGVLIALGAQQLVEAWQWRHETSATRDALRGEAADNLAAAVQRSQQQPCVEQRLNTGDILASETVGQRPKQLGVTPAAVTLARKEFCEPLLR